MRVLASIICFVAIVAVLLSAQPAQPSALTLAVAPEAAVEVTRLQLDAQTQQARIAAEEAAHLARERTLRLAIGAGAAVAVLLASAVVLQVARHAKPPVVILLPADPRFARALHDLGGVRINGVPMLEGRVVEYIEVEAEER